MDKHYECLFDTENKVSLFRGGSRICRWGHPPVGEGGGADFQRRSFLVKMYVKTKELGPVGEGACARHTSRSANALAYPTYVVPPPDKSTNRENVPLARSLRGE